MALLESLYMWPFVESTHVLALGLFVGTTVLMDLTRLLGVAFRKVPITAFTGRLLPWTHIGFIIMTVTGLLLFYSQPVRYYYNLFFRIKVLVLLLAGANVAIFHNGVHRHAAEWDHDASPPRAARIAGAVSLAVWAVVGGDGPPHRLQLVRLRHPAPARVGELGGGMPRRDGVAAMTDTTAGG